MGGFLQRLFEAAFRGLRAVTTQSYVEANVKNGCQFAFSSYEPALAASGVIELFMVTGSKPVVLKGRTFNFDGEGIFVETFTGATYTGGTPVDLYPTNDINQNEAEFQLIGGATVDTEGAIFISPRTYIGSEQPNNRSVSTASQEAFGIETVFAPNTTYLFRITSIDATEAQRFVSYTTWYEGELDLPVVN